jgi:hypothetical protein
MQNACGEPAVKKLKTASEEMCSSQHEDGDGSAVKKVKLNPEQQAVQVAGAGSKSGSASRTTNMMKELGLTHEAEHVDLKGRVKFLTTEFLRPLLAACPNMKTLDLSGNGFVCMKGLVDLMENNVLVEVDLRE